jgi:SP family sugar:H+ symporter-like MFS transporter
VTEPGSSNDVPRKDPTHDSGDLDAQVARAHTGKAIGIAIAAAVGGFLFGFDTAVINGAVDAVQGHFKLDSLVTGLVVAVALIGSAVGAWFAGQLADRWGRTRIMLIGAILFLISALGSAFAFSAWDLALWRFIGGLGIGVASVIGPTYISEIAPARLRGRLSSLQQMAIVLGIFIALLSDTAFANGAGGASGDLWGMGAWRWMFLVGVIPAAVYGILSLTIPESPRFLVGKGREDEASTVLQKVLGETREEISARIESIKESMKRETAPSLRDIRGNRFGLLPIVWIGILIAVFQQFVGINVIFYYSTSLWQAVGFDESFSFTASVITSIVNVVVTIVAILLVDRIGRRILLLVGSAGMAISLILMAIGFSQSVLVNDVPQLPGAWGPLTLVAANAFVVFFGASWGPVMWVLLGEMFPNRIRGVAMAIATAANWLANFVVTITFPPLSDFSLGLTYGIYAFFAALSFVFVFLKVPETKGMELEDMSNDFTVKRGKAVAG